MHSKEQYLRYKYFSKIILCLKKKDEFYRSKYNCMNKYLTIVVFLLIFILSPTFVQTTIAQPPPPPPVEIPIDGGLGFLLAAGVAYAAKKLYNSRNEE